MKTEHIDRIEEHETGGNCSVTLIHLPDGRVLGINNECLVLYRCIDDFNDGVPFNLGCIDLVQSC